MNNNTKVTKPTEPIKTTINALVFEGGGILGTAHIGALSVAVNHFDMSKVKVFAGASAGSMVATLCACRIPIDMIHDAIKTISYPDMLDDDYGFLCDAKRLLTKFGYHKGDMLETIFSNILEKCIGNSEITIGEIYQKYDSYLIIPVTEMFKSCCKTKYFTPDSDPDVKVATIVRYSSSYPFIFACKNNYSDGGILDNYPIKKVNERIPLESILGFKFNTTKNTKDTDANRPSNIIDFSSAIISGLIDKGSHFTDAELKRTIIISTKNYVSMNLNISNEDKDNLYALGIDAAIAYYATTK